RPAKFSPEMTGAPPARSVPLSARLGEWFRLLPPRPRWRCSKGAVVSAVGRAFGVPSFSWRVAEEPHSPPSSLVISETGIRSGGKHGTRTRVSVGRVGRLGGIALCWPCRITIETAKRRWLALVHPIYGPRWLPHPPAPVQVGRMDAVGEGAARRRTRDTRLRNTHPPGSVGGSPPCRSVQSSPDWIGPARRSCRL